MKLVYFAVALAFALLFGSAVLVYFGVSFKICLACCVAGSILIATLVFAGVVSLLFSKQ